METIPGQYVTFNDYGWKFIFYFFLGRGGTCCIPFWGHFGTLGVFILIFFLTILQMFVGRNLGEALLVHDTNTTNSQL